MATASWQDMIAGRTTGRFVHTVEDGGTGGGGGGTDGGAGKGGDGGGGEGGSGGDGGSKEFKSIGSQEELDRIISNRLAREREKYADHDELKKKAEELAKIQDAQKSELQKATELATTSETKASEAELRALRLEVAIDKGLNATQAKRLVGKTKEELEKDADDLIASFKTDGDGSGDGKKPAGRPRERLSGGGDPTDEPSEMDPRKLAEGVSRY